MKRISVRIIQSLSDYPGNMELCQVEEVCNCGCAVSVYYECVPVCGVCVASLKSSGILYTD